MNMIARCPYCGNEYEIELDHSVGEITIRCPKCKVPFVINNQKEQRLNQIRIVTNAKQESNTQDDDLSRYLDSKKKRKRGPIHISSISRALFKERNSAEEGSSNRLKAAVKNTEKGNGLIIILLVIFLLATIGYMVCCNGSNSPEVSEVETDSVKVINDDEVIAFLENTDSMEEVSDDDSFTGARECLDDAALFSKQMETSTWVDSKYGNFKVPKFFGDEMEFSSKYTLCTFIEYLQYDVIISCSPYMGGWAHEDDVFPVDGSELAKNVFIKSITYKSSKKLSIFSGYTEDGRIFYMKKKNHDQVIDPDEGISHPNPSFLAVIYPEDFKNSISPIIDMIKKW